MNMEESDTESFPVTVVKKKIQDSFLYRLRRDNTKCYRFHYKGGSLCIVCTTCRTIFDMARRANKTRPRIIPREFDGFSTAIDPELDHLPECKPDVYDDVLKNYSLVPQVQKGEKFSLARVQKKLNYCVLYRLPGDDTRCYRFNLRTIRLSYSLLSCSTCSSRRDSKKSTASLNDTVLTRRMTEFGFATDPALFHRHDCQPEVMSNIMNTFERVDHDAAQQFLMHHFGQSLRKIVNLQQDGGITSQSCNDLRKTDTSTEGARQLRRSPRLMLQKDVPEQENQEEKDEEHEEVPSRPSDETFDENVDDTRDQDEIVQSNDSSGDERISSYCDDREAREVPMVLHNTSSDTLIAEPLTSYESLDTDVSLSNMNNLQRDAVLAALPDEGVIAVSGDIKPCNLNFDEQIRNRTDEHDIIMTSDTSQNNEIAEKEAKPEPDLPRTVDDVDDDIIFIEMLPLKRRHTSRNNVSNTNKPTNVIVPEENTEAESTNQQVEFSVLRINSMMAKKEVVEDANTEAAEIETVEPTAKKIKLEEDDDIIFVRVRQGLNKKTDNTSHGAANGGSVQGDTNLKNQAQQTVNTETKPRIDATHDEVTQEEHCQQPLKLAVSQPERISLASYVEVLKTFDFKPDEISITKDGRFIRVEFPREADSASLTNSLSYCVEPPESVDISTIRTAWHAGKLTIIGENRN